MTILLCKTETYILKKLVTFDSGIPCFKKNKKYFIVVVKLYIPFITHVFACQHNCMEN